MAAVADIQSTKPLIGEASAQPPDGNWTSQSAPTTPHLSGFFGGIKRGSSTGERQSRSTYGLNQVILNFEIWFSFS